MVSQTLNLFQRMLKAQFGFKDIDKLLFKKKIDLNNGQVLEIKEIVFQ